jgi:uncharacterized protein YxjI
MSESTALASYKTHYVAKKALFTFLGAAFRLYTPEGELAFFVKQKAFKIREQITVFADEGMSDARLAIQARQRLDISATYDVTEVASGEKVGALQRKGLKSIFMDEWSILDNDDAVIGSIKEASALMAILSRIIKLIPQTYNINLGETQAGVIKQRFNPFQLAYDVDFGTGDASVDPRLGVAAVVLLLAIEGRQQ